MRIEAGDMHFRQLNQLVRDSRDPQIHITNCNGQRYIGSGLSGKRITIEGTPGNALGSYLDGCDIEVLGNAQDATGDTMNEGTIVIHGSSGDATGYAMRGGRIYVKGGAGYRAGIHMKAYQDKLPVLVIGGRAGSFLGEYQAGGLIIVLGGGDEEGPCADRFCGTGMHGGKIFLRCTKLPLDLAKQVLVKKAEPSELAEITPHVLKYCGLFGGNAEKILSGVFYVLTPDTQNPYKQLYTHN